MKTVTLSAKGIKFDSDFKTTVTSVKNPDKDSSIVLDALPKVRLSLGDESATSLGIEVGSVVTIKANEGSDGDTFTMEVGPKEAPKKAAAAAKSPAPAPRGNGASHHMVCTNALN